MTKDLIALHYAVSAYKVTPETMTFGVVADSPDWMQEALKAGIVYFDDSSNRLHGPSWTLQDCDCGIIPWGHYLARCGENGKICIVPPELFEGENGFAVEKDEDQPKTWKVTKESMLGPARPAWLSEAIAAGKIAHKFTNDYWAIRGEGGYSAIAWSGTLTYQDGKITAAMPEAETVRHTAADPMDDGEMRWNGGKPEPPEDESQIGLAEPVINDPDDEPDRPQYKCGHPFVAGKTHFDMLDDVAAPGPPGEHDDKRGPQLAPSLAKWLERTESESESATTDRAEWIRETAADLFADFTEQDNRIWNVAAMADDAILAATKIYDGVKD